MLDQIDGVQTVKSVTFTNKAGTSQGYSEWAYDMNGANQNGTISHHLDPSIFELKYPNTDIKGRVVNIIIMAVYKLFPSQDAAIYSAYPAMNTGLDPILDVANYVTRFKSNI
jgi:hypothetical protein